MANIITLKSRLLRAGDPMQADISRFKVPLTPDETLYERELLAFRRRFAATEEAGEVAARDTVTLTCHSELPRFCKEHIGVRVGQGLFSRELENQIIGWKAGQTGEVTVKEKPVTVTVERVQREILPEVDDAMAARCGEPGIRTAKDIHAWCRGKQFDDELEEAASEVYRVLSQHVIETSEFQIDPEELAASEKRMIDDFIQGPLRGQSLDSISDEEFQERFFQSKEGHLAFLHMVAGNIIQDALLGMARREELGRPVTEDDYTAWLRRYIENKGISEEEARQAHPVLEYAIDQLAGEYMDYMEALALFRLKEDLA